MRRGSQQAFSLVEMLVALAVLALLAAIAWPGYLRVVHRSLRVEARLALLKLQYLQERHYADHHAYSSTLPVAAVTEGGNYELSMELDADGQAYVAVARARPAGRQSGDHQCQRLSIDTVGARRSAAVDGDWRPEPGPGCWG